VKKEGLNWELFVPKSFLNCEFEVLKNLENVRKNISIHDIKSTFESQTKYKDFKKRMFYVKINTNFND
jgi:hypothetical protein